MIPLARLPLVVVLGLASVVAVGLVFGPMTPAFEDLTMIVWLIVLIEAVVYFLAALLSNPEIGAVRAWVLSLLLCFTRFLLCAMGGMVLAVFVDHPLGESILRVWVGNPAGAFVQAFLLMLVAPHALQILAPGLVSESMVQVMEGGDESQNAIPLVRSEYSVGSEPVGGFIQVFSLQELQSMFRKSIGMEGFIIYTAEGLVLWKDMPIRLDVDELTARIHALMEEAATTIEEFGLTRVRKTVIESREHTIFQTRLNPNFGLIMLFAGSVKIDECWTRLGVLARTTKEYLQWKYPNLGSLKQLPAAPIAAET